MWNIVEDLRVKLGRIKEAGDKKEFFTGDIIYAEPKGHFYKVKIENDYLLEGQEVFVSYGDLLQNERHLGGDSRIDSTTGQVFNVGDKVKFQVALDLRGFHVEKA